MSVPVADTKATLISVAESRMRIGKRMYWSPAGSKDGVWKEPGLGEWQKPSDIGFPKKADSLVGKNYRWHVFDIRSMEERCRLRQELSQNINMALVWGVPADAYLDKFKQENEHHRVADYGTFRRLDSVFVDAPRDYLMLDIDELNLGVFDDSLDVIRDHDRLGPILMDVLGAIGLDWLLADCIIHLSSTHALSGRQRFKAHVEWKLSSPLTIAQQKSVATYVNEQAIKAGYGKICDATICDPARILFTSPPQTLKRVWHDGKGILDEPTPAPVTDRVRLFRYGELTTDVPECALALHRSEQRAQKVRKLTHIGHHPDAAALGRKAAGKPVGKNVLEPGNVYNYVRGEIFKAAKTAPAHRIEEVLARLQSRLESAILSLGSEDAAQLEKRLSYVKPEEVRRSFLAAYHKRKPYTEIAREGYVTQSSPSAVRAALNSEMGRIIDAGIAHRKGMLELPTGEENALITTPPPAVHTLIRVPPGVGKTYAALAAVRPDHMSTNRIAYYSPTTRLSEEAADRRRATLPKDDYWATRVRHHKGRRQVCREPNLNKIATQLESIGMSPLKPVCFKCPLKDACAWPQQHSDVDSGLVAGQHAHIPTTLQKTGTDTEGAPAVMIVDESMLSTLLQERHKARSIAALRRHTKRLKIRNQSGDTIRGATTDAITYRDRILTALEGAKHLLPATVELRWFLTEITIETANAKFLRARIDDAITSEYEVQRSAKRDLDKALDELTRTPGPPARSPQARFTRAKNIIEISGFFIALYRATRESLNIPARDHVFGIRVSNRRVSAHIRAELPHIFADTHTVWLDGTAQEAVWVATLGRLPVVTQTLDLPVEPGTYRLTQFADRPYSKRMFQMDAVQPHSNLQRLRRFILSLAAEHPKVLVVAQLALTTALSSLLPPNVHLEHFNALRGIDAYKDFPAAVIVGRPLPKNADLEAMAEALYFDDPQVSALTSAGNKPLTGSRSIHTHTSSVTFPCERHPDARIESLRHQLVDAEVQQAVNRLRLYDRDPSRPAHIYVFGQANIGLPVHELHDWQDADRTPSEVIAASGIWSTSPDIARSLSLGLLEGYPDKNFERLLKQPEHTKNWTLWLVKLPGAQRRRRFLIDPARHGTSEREIVNAVAHATGQMPEDAKNAIIDEKDQSLWLVAAE